MPAQPLPPGLVQALTAWEEKTREEARQEGYSTGYQAGWDAATAALVEAVASKRTPAQSLGRQVQPTGLSGPPLKRAALKNSRDYVVEALTARPGMRPSELVNWVVNKYPHQVNGNALLTQIKRMRKEKPASFEQRSDSVLYLVHRSGKGAV